MGTKTRIFAIASMVLAAVALQSCKHPLAIVGEGDIVDANNSGHGCTLEQFQARDTVCTENDVSGDYFVNYKAEPRPGWRFVRWDGPCAPRSDFQYCRLNFSQAGVVWWDETYPDAEIPPSTAVFAPITGNTGFLAGPAVAGVAWETPTQRGVTGLDGSFQYEKGETVRFKIGDTLLGKVTGQAQVTPFDLAASPVVTGTNINWALEDEGEGEVDPFQAVVNIAVFLQTLDHDADPENGLQIRPGVAALFQGVNLDMGQHWRAFQKESTLHSAIGQANRKHRFSVAHGLVKPAAALEHLYQALDIDAHTVGISWLKIEGRDGNPERTERFQYDASGNMIRHDDGTPDAVESWQYDASGNLTRYERDAEKYIEFNAYRIVEAWQYDTNDNVTRRERDYDADGTLEEIATWRYQYDINGNVKRKEENWDADGTTDNIESWQYDTRGNVTRKEWDWDADDTPDDIETWQYDTRGNVTRKERDYDADGTPDAFESWKYDASGNVTRYESGPSSGSGWQDLKTWQYDTNGNVTQITEEWSHIYDPGGYIETWQYDTNGKVIRVERVGADGRLEEITTRQYDTNGNVVVLEVKERFSEGRVVIAGNDPPGYNGGSLFANGVALPESAVNDIAFITYVDEAAPQASNENGRDQGRIFNTGGTVPLTTDTLSQSITAGISGQLTGIQIQFNSDVSAPSPLLSFSIFAGANPPKGDALYSEELDLESIASSDLFTWDLTDANLFFEAGDRFTFALIAHGEVTPNRIGSYRYEHDANGKLTRYERDDNGDGIPDNIVSWQYDAKGNVTRERSDWGADGTPDNVETWQYNADGNLTHYEMDENGDGMIDEATTYQYKATGWGHFFSDARMWYSSWPPEKPGPDPDSLQ